MTKAGWLRGFFFGACVLGAAALGLGWAQPWEDTRPVEQRAADSQAALRWEAAVKFYQTFIDSSVGDPRVAAAKKQMHECALALVKEWTAEGREADAAKLLLWLAEDGVTPKEQQAAMVKQAATVMTGALAEAKQKHQCARGLALARDFAAIFPDKTCPIGAEELDTMAADGLIAACQDKYNLMALPEVAKQFYPDKEPAWDALAKKSRGENLQLGYFRTLSEMGWSGRFIGDHAGLASDSPLRLNQGFCNQLEKVLVGRADAWASQGNVGMGMEAVEAARAVLVTDSKISALHVVEAKIKARGVLESKELDFPGPVKGKVSWQDAGGGFTANDVQLDTDADITVKAGFLLTGGKLNLAGAHLHLQGTPGQPVVFRDVSLSLEPGSSIEAENAVFINCTFGRSGERLMMKYASKWVFSGCMFYRTRFSSLGISAIGLRMTNCAWVEGSIPERNAPPGAGVMTYKDRWNQVSDCMFYRVTLSPSTVWMTDKCDFVRCSLAGTSQYDCKAPMLVTLFIPDMDPMGPGLFAGMTVLDKGDLKYSFSRKPFDVGVPAMFWGLLPVEGHELPKGKKRK